MENTYTDLVKKQRRFFEKGTTLDIGFRIEALKRLKKAIVEEEEKIEIATKKDLNKSKFETYFGELGGVLVEIDFHIRNLKKWSKAKRVQTPIFLKPSYSRIVYDPYGVTLILSPWNYPFQLAIMPLIGAISAGNTAIIKPSELSPNTSQLIKSLIESIFPREYIAVVEGGVVETTALLEERFDFIFFTGSISVGKMIAQKAAETLTPVVLELGGKSPVIIDDFFPMDVAVRRISMAKITNCGQTCVSPDYILLPKKRKQEFVNAFQNTVREFFPIGSLEDGDTYESMARIINKNHFNRLEKLFKDEDIIWGGGAFYNELKFQPTLINSGSVKDFLDKNREKPAILKEEIFGPFFPILTYDDIDEVVAYINSDEKPLALYLFSEKKALQKKVVREISFGGGCVNDSMIHLANEYLPFGGVGHSGQGAYHGKASFLAFSHEKSLLYSRKNFDLSTKYMPHTDKKLKLLKKIFK